MSAIFQLLMYFDCNNEYVFAEFDLYQKLKVKLWFFNPHRRTAKTHMQIMHPYVLSITVLYYLVILPVHAC